MNTEQMSGKWKQMKGAVQQKWGKLTDNDLQVINGQRDMLVGKLQERYGLMKEEAQKRADEFFKSYESEEENEHTTYGKTHDSADRDKRHQAHH